MTYGLSDQHFKSYEETKGNTLNSQLLIKSGGILFLDLQKSRCLYHLTRKNNFSTFQRIVGFILRKNVFLTNIMDTIAISLTFATYREQSQKPKSASARLRGGLGIAFPIRKIITAKTRVFVCEILQSNL